MTVQADSAVWLPVLPSMRDFGPALIKGAGGEADKAGSQVGKRFGKAITVGIAAAGAGAMAAGAFLYKVGEVFDDVADTIRVGTGATGDALDGLVDSAKRVGQNVPAEFEQVGTTVADINTRMGLTGGTLETVASQYLEAGRILGEDVDINKTSAAFNAFGIEGEAVVGAMDHLFQVSQATGVGMNDLATVVSVNAPAMKQLGFSFEETAVLAGELDKAGLNSNKMMAAMSKGMVTLAKDGEAPQEAFKRVVGEIQGFIASGDEAAALELAGKVFGTKGAPQFIDALASGRVNLDDLTQAAGQTSDSILDVGAETMDFAEAWQLFKNNVLVWLEPLGATVFGALGTWMGAAVDAVGAFTDAWGRADGTITQGGLLGFMEALAGKVREVYDWFQISLIPALAAFGGWVQQNSSWLGLLAVTLGAAGAAVGILVGAFKAWAAVTKAVAAAKLLLTTGFAKLNAVMAANPIGIVVTVLAALVAAAIYAYTQFDWFRQVVDGAWNGIKAAAQAAWEGVIRPVFAAIGTWITGTLVPAFVHFWQGVIVPAWQGIGGAVKQAWEGTILPALRGIWAWVTQTLAPAFVNFYRGVIVPVWEGVKTAVRVAGAVLGVVFASIRTTWEALARAFDWAWRYVLKPVFDAVSVVATAMWKVVGFVLDVMKNTAILVFDVIAFAWRTVLRPAFEAIGVFFRDTVWNGMLRPAFGAVRAGWDVLVKAIRWAWENILRPAWDAVAAGALWLWEKGLAPYFEQIKKNWKAVLDAMVWAWQNVLRPAWDALIRFGARMWTDWLRPTFDKIRAGWDVLMRGIRSLWQDILKPTWDKVAGAASSLWNDRLKPAFDRIRGGWEGMINGIRSLWTDKLRPIFNAVGDFVKKDLKGKIDDGVRMIKDSWKGLANGFRTPINWVIDKVWNNGISKAFNKVAEVVGSGARIGAIDGIPAYAKGGLAKPGWALVGEEGPELVNFDQPGRVYTAKQTQQMLAAKGPTDFGPPVGALPTRVAVPHAIPSAALPQGGLVEWALGGLVEASKRLLDPIMSTAKAALSGMGLMGRVAHDAARSAVDRVLDWIKPQDKAPEPTAADPGGQQYGVTGHNVDFSRRNGLKLMNAGAAAALGIPLGSFPSNGRISSWFGYRRTPQGMPDFTSNHTGVDFFQGGFGKTYASHSGRVFQSGQSPDSSGSYTIGIVHPRPGGGRPFYTFYAHNPVGGSRVSNGQWVESGQHIGYEGNTGYSTGNHLHYGLVASQGSGAANINALFRDQGGNLPPGLSLVLNNTGRDEYILNRGQAAALAGAAGRGFPAEVTLVVEDGPTLRAYVEDVGDRRLASHVAGLAQPLRQHTGA